MKYIYTWEIKLIDRITDNIIRKINDYIIVLRNIYIYIYIYI